MTVGMPDSPLNEPEHRLQLSFRKSPVFNSLLFFCVVLATYLPIRELPDRRLLPARQVELSLKPISLPPAADGPLRIAGAWLMSAGDSRFGGLSALTVDGGQFLAVSDLGAVIRFDPPGKRPLHALLMDLRSGPGPAGRKKSRDAEALVVDPRGRGWWVGYEQRHSLWLYDRGFKRALAAIPVRRDWRDNRGIEALLVDRDGLLALAENGREAIRVDSAGLQSIDLSTGWEVADAATAPDSSAWLLLRSKGRRGIAQAVAPLIQTRRGYRIGKAWPLPKAAFDNYEGMAIRPSPGGGWRFWLVTDDGHRFMARTLLVALDLDQAQENARR
jgi:hypothetical protein